jgi:hypothetical protein
MLTLVLLQSVHKLLGWLLSIPLRIVLCPLPQIRTRILKSQLSLPVQLLVGERRVSRQIQDIAVPSWSNLVCKISSDDMAECLDHLEYSGTTSTAQVPCLDTGLLFAQVVERLEMAAREVEHVDVIADRGAVLGLVVVAKDEKLLALTDSDLCEQRQEVVGYAERVLAHDARGMGTGRVEVTQQCSVPLLAFLFLAVLLRLVALRINGVCDDAFYGGLCATVDICRADGAVFGDGDHVGESGRIAVDGGGGREDDVGDIVLYHGR